MMSTPTATGDGAPAGLRQRRPHISPGAPEPVLPSSSVSSAAQDLDALVRTRYFSHVSVQLVLSNAPAVTLLMNLLLTGGRRRGVIERCFLYALLAALPAMNAAALRVPLRRALPRWARARDEATAVGVALLLDWLANLLITPLLFGAFLWDPTHRASNCGSAGADSLGECALVYMRTFGFVRVFRAAVAQVPLRLSFTFEVLRAGVLLLCALVAFATDGALSPLNAVRAAAHAALALVATCALLMLHFDSRFATRLLPPWLDLWPRRAAPLRDALLDRLAACLPQPPLHHNVLCGINLLALTLAAQPDTHMFSGMARAARIALRVYFTLSGMALASARLSGGGLLQLSDMARRLALDGDAAVVESVRVAVAQAGSEEEVLRCSCVALMQQLFQGSASGIVLRLAPHGACAQPLRVAVGADGADAADEDAYCDEEGGDTSRDFVLSQELCTIADSRDFPDGLASFSDWARLGAAHGDTVLVTAPLPAGPARLGTLLVRFGRRGQRRAALPAPQYEALLMRCCRAIGEGLFTRREHAASQAASAVACDIFPSHVVQRLVQRNMRISVSGFGSVARPPRASISSRGSFDSNPATLTPTLPEPRAGAAAFATAAEVDARASPAAVALRTARISCVSEPMSEAVEDDEDDPFFYEEHECLAVVFIDIVGSTQLAEEARSPLATMRMLHGLFSRFDALCEPLGVYKLETVGDEYVAVAGLLPPRPAAAAAAAALLVGLRVHAAAAAVGLQVRVGVHAGPATSGLIGRIRARFCLYGDVMNTGSRLESAGEAGCVQCSCDTWALAGLPAALLQTRSLQLKGKAAPLEAYLLPACSPEAEQVELLLEAALRAAQDDT